MKTFTWVLPVLPRKHFLIAAHSLKLSAGIAESSVTAALPYANLFQVKQNAAMISQNESRGTEI